MEKEDVKKALNELKEKSSKRNFKQTVDLVITLSGLDLKKSENQVDFTLNLPNSTGKDIKVAAFTGPELKASAKENCDEVIDVDEFPKYAKDKKAIKKLSKEYDYFIAQANIMPKIASTFGKVLGPRGKMPNPKAGCVVPPNANLKQLVTGLKSTSRVTAKTSLMCQNPVGKEDQEEEKIAENVLAIYDALMNHLPGGKQNVKNVYIKLTMSKPKKLEI